MAGGAGQPRFEARPSGLAGQAGQERLAEEGRRRQKLGRRPEAAFKLGPRLREVGEELRKRNCRRGIAQTGSGTARPRPGGPAPTSNKENMAARQVRLKNVAKDICCNVWIIVSESQASQRTLTPELTCSIGSIPVAVAVES